ncbi:MAG: DUF1887 family protein [Symploca sp. SIO2G7]|nr:DUF1887 family protein [Symploca sp. SIO2G7]
MSTSEFDKYKVEHLFLLIGENPLPNYVAAMLLLKEGGTPYLVYTTHTEKQAKRLQTILKDESIGLKAVQLVPLQDYESDAFHIKKIISSRLNISNGTIGLNYTGGTKAMAVHAYRAVFSTEHSDTVFSYLDPRRLEMCIDRENDSRIRLKVKPDVLPVKLAKLFQIHDLKLKANPTKEAQLPDLAAALAEVFKDEEQTKQWFDWYFNVFCAEARKKKNERWGDWKSESDLAGLSISLENLPPEVMTYLEGADLVTPDKALSLQAVKQQRVFQKIKHFGKYLDGLWLEHHVLQQVKNIAEQNSINDYGLNFEVPLPGTRGGFEFDVAFTRGYQLFAISVSTTSKRDLCKSKLFEAYLRARQMGGDEARVALICCSDEPDSLKAEMANSLGDKKIAVFGRDDLLNLASKIEQWIQQNEKDAR